MRISFNRNGFIALASMLSFAVYAGDNLPLATAASGTNGSIQVSEHGVDTSNEIHSNVSRCSRKRMPVPDSCTSHSTRMTPRNSQGAGLHGPIHCLENCCGKHSMIGILIISN